MSRDQSREIDRFCAPELGRGFRRGVCASYVVLALLYNAFTPIGESPDELAHFQYLRLVADDARLPGAADDLWQGHQAPLYYVAQAAWARLIQAVSGCRIDLAQLPSRRRASVPPTPNFNLLEHPVQEWVTSWGCQEWSYHLLRLLSTAFTVPMIFGTFAILREALPRAPAAVAIGGTLTALMPSHVAISAMLNNDALALLLVIATTHRVLRACRTDDVADLAAAALLAALAVTAKLSAAYLFGLVLAAVALRRPLRRRLLEAGPARVWLLLAASAALVPILLLARNLREWGDPFAVAALERNLALLTAAGDNPPGRGLLHFYAVELPVFLARAFPIAYGAINFRAIEYGEVFRWGMYLLGAGIALSLLFRGPWRQVERVPVSILVVGFVLFFAAFCYPGYRYRFLQARYFFGQLPLVSLVAAIGIATLRELVGRLGWRWSDRALVAATYLYLVSLNLLVLATGVVPHLYRFVGAPG